MNDCPNVTIREALPDLLHGRLDEIARRRVAGHLEECADCRAEMELLRDLRAALLARSRAVDEQQLVRAIAPYRGPARSFARWQVAAAIVVLLAGGGTVRVLTRTSEPVQHVDAVAGTTAASPELSMAGGLGALDEADLRAILSEIDHLDAMPSIDPEPVGLSLGSEASSSGMN